MATDYNSKYSGPQIDALLDMVAAGVGGVIVSQETYITPFTAEDVVTITSNETGTIFIPLALIEAILTKKRVLIPSQTVYGGYVAVIQAEGYIAEEGATDAGVRLAFILKNILYVIDIDDAVENGGITFGYNQIISSAIASEDTYIAPFDAGTVESIANNGNYTLFIPLDLIRAILVKKRVLIPFNSEFGDGYVVVIQADGYIEEGGGSAKNAGVWLTFIHRDILYNISQDDAVVSGGITVSRENVSARQL